MRSYFLFAIMTLLVLASCSNGHNDAAFNKYLATADSTKFSSDITDPHSPSRKILHSADLSYRVPDVLKAITQAEQAVKGFGGIVAKSEMHNESGLEKDVPYKKDSLKHAKIYAPVGEMVVQVPVEKMDSFVNMLSANAQFVNHRMIAQQDVTYTYLSNALKNQNFDNGGKPAPYKAPAQDANAVLAERNKNVDNADAQVDRKIENLQLIEQANYATIAIKFEQPEQVDVQVVADPAYVTELPFGVRFVNALGNGVTIIREMFLVMVQLWPLWIILGTVLYWYRRRRLVKGLKG